jgi:tripartite-type tricarboxylate transporter receptor subunit TctC
MRNETRRLLTSGLLVVIAGLGGWGQGAHAQDKYPSRAIDIIVPFAPGGFTDLSARTTGAYLSKKWGVPVSVIDKPGARGIPQTQELYRAAPDGYTLLADNPSTNSILAAAMGKELPFNALERTFIGINTGTPYTLIVAPDSPYKSLAQLLADAKKNPEKISYTSQGATGSADLFIRVLLKDTGVDVAKLQPVMVSSGSAIVPMAAGGHVTMGLPSASSAHAAVQGNLVRALVISSRDRDPDYPGVPTTVELGYPVVMSWNGLSGPPNMPMHIVTAISRALKESVEDPAFLANLKKFGAIPFYHDSQGMKEYVRSEIEETAKLMAPGSK